MRPHLHRGSVGQQLIGGEAVLLLHGPAEDLLHAAGQHRQPCNSHAQHIPLHAEVCDGPAPGHEAA